MSEIEKLSLVNIKGGAAVEMFDNALQKVLENIHDPNTTLDAREITLKVSIKPMDEHRSIVVYGIKCPIKTAGQEAVKGIADMMIKDGRLIAVGRREVQQGFDFSNITAITGGGKKDE